MPTCAGPGCGAEILFVPNAKSGKTVILDAKPERRYLLVDETDYVGDEGDMEIVLVGPGEGAVAVLVETRVDHHATCPAFAAGWRPGR